MSAQPRDRLVNEVKIEFICKIKEFRMHSEAKERSKEGRQHRERALECDSINQQRINSFNNNKTKRFISTHIDLSSLIHLLVVRLQPLKTFSAFRHFYFVSPAFISFLSSTELHSFVIWFVLCVGFLFLLTLSSLLCVTMHFVYLFVYFFLPTVCEIVYNFHFSQIKCNSNPFH